MKLGRQVGTAASRTHQSIASWTPWLPVLTRAFSLEWRCTIMMNDTWW